MLYSDHLILYGLYLFLYYLYILVYIELMELLNRLESLLVLG